MDANDLALVLTTLSTIKYCYEAVYSGPEVDAALDASIERFLSVAERAKALAEGQGTDGALPGLHDPVRGASTAYPDRAPSAGL